MSGKMIVGGLVGGLIGVAIWIAVGMAGFEVGWIAWGIGALAGIGTRVFNETDSAMGALSAAVIAGLMVLLGKVVVYKVVVGDQVPFSEMFAGWDILWFLLACGTAARLAFEGEGDD